KADKTEAIKHLAEFAGKRGLQIHTSKEMRTEWDLENDPALAPLVAAFREMMHDPRNPYPDDYSPFATDFFWQLTQRGRTPATGTFALDFYPPGRFPNPFEMEKQPQFVVWRKAEEPARPVNFDVAADAVKAAWKRGKARELAKAKAEAIANKLRASDKNSEDT